MEAMVISDSERKYKLDFQEYKLMFIPDSKAMFGECDFILLEAGLGMLIFCFNSEFCIE